MQKAQVVALVKKTGAITLGNASAGMRLSPVMHCFKGFRLSTPLMWVLKHA